jgi:anaerobic ribonucleoside-triphosphate reductase activating protein
MPERVIVLNSVPTVFPTRHGIAQDARRRIWEDIKRHLDFAVLGRFVTARPSQLPMRTSTNQVLQLFGGRYREEHFMPLEFEVHIEAQGLVQITGFPLAGLPV